MREEPRVLPELALLVVIGALEALLLRVTGAPPSHLQVLADLANPMAGPLEGMLAALALTAEALAGYLMLALALRTLTRLPGLAGQAAHRAERMLTVPAVRRGLDALLGGALIAQLVLAPAATGAGAGTVRALPPAAAKAAVSTERRPWTDQPGSAGPGSETAEEAPAPPAARSPVPLPLPVWLGGDLTLRGVPSPPQPRRLTAHQTAADRSRRAPAPIPPPAADTGRPTPEPSAEDRAAGPRPARSARTHTIAPGDTLWSIAAGHLPAEAGAAADIATYWRRIYGANRDAVGPDPDRIRPGVTLSIPPYQASTAPQQRRRAAHAAAAPWPRAHGSAAHRPDELP